MSQRRINKSTNVISQHTLEDFTEIDPTEAINNVVRYIVYRAGDHNFSKAELVRHVIGKTSGKYEEIIEKVKTILKKVYGYNLINCENIKGKDKHYIVSNGLPYISDPTEKSEETPEDANKILLLLILSHIFMSNNSVSDASLYDFLKSLGIDVDLIHPIFGNVREYITKILIKKQYLFIETDSISKRQTFKWGLRAEKEISKMAILEFVCKMLKGKPTDWVNHYQIAEQQVIENKIENIGVPMEF